MTDRLTGYLTDNYRYIFLFASMLALLTGIGSKFLSVVVLKPIAAEFEWPRAISSFAHSLQLISGGIGAILMGIWLDRWEIAAPEF